MKTLNVKATTNQQLSKEWNMHVFLKGPLFIRCNSKGIVNWEKAPAYNLDELLLRGNVKVIV